MQIVIDIPDRIYYGAKNGITVNGSDASQILIDAVKNSTPLPKGHGDLKDVSDIEWAKFTRETSRYEEAKCVDWDVVENAPTIIEADKED